MTFNFLIQLTETDKRILIALFLVLILVFVLIGLLGAPQFFRYIHNKDIFRARYKIATTLGLIKKAPIDLSDQKEIYRFDYGYNKYYFIKHQKIDKQQE